MEGHRSTDKVTLGDNRFILPQDLQTMGMENLGCRLLLHPGACVGLPLVVGACCQIIKVRRELLGSKRRDSSNPYPSRAVKFIERIPVSSNERPEDHR